MYAILTLTELLLFWVWRAIKIWPTIVTVMSYDIGTHIDLSGLNQKREVAATRPKKSFAETTRQAHQVGTQFIFQLTPAGIRAAIRIPVLYA